MEFDNIAGFFLGGLAVRSGMWGSLIMATGAIAAQWLFLWWLYRSRTFLRL